ncbi:unnamed product [Ostreococcus tauri]|uniref:Unnamed product n=1 Tax=Ostreococcus tauri TaxID=70448 RepID=A0A090M858_OSTTA|nr:unnamed product [Ostreococcus tauri]CEG01323.1 unnamed product [Ostreococcus tauri]|eukprot:XP_003080590.2 unnamed product [Ostreococcus tauri]
MASQMGKPMIGVLERGFDGESMAKETTFEHEGAAETLGEPIEARDRRRRETTEDTARAVSKSIVEEDVNGNHMDVSEDLDSAHDQPSVHYSRMVFPSVARVTDIVRIPARLFVTILALVYIPIVIHTQVVLTVLSFWAISIAKSTMMWVRPLLSTSMSKSTGWEALYDHVAHEVDDFSERTMFLFPGTPKTNHDSKKSDSMRPR